MSDESREDLRLAIGRRLRAIRRSRKLTIEEVTKYTGIAKSTLGDYELGTRNISIFNLIILCKIYRVQSDYILLLRDTPFDLKETNSVSKSIA